MKKFATILLTAITMMAFMSCQPTTKSNDDGVSYDSNGYMSDLNNTWTGDVTADTGNMGGYFTAYEGTYTKKTVHAPTPTKVDVYKTSTGTVTTYTYYDTATTTVQTDVTVSATGVVSYTETTTSVWTARDAAPVNTASVRYEGFYKAPIVAQTNTTVVTKTYTPTYDAASNLFTTVTYVSTAYTYTNNSAANYTTTSTVNTSNVTRATVQSDISAYTSGLTRTAAATTGTDNDNTNTKTTVSLTVKNGLFNKTTTTVVTQTAVAASANEDAVLAGTATKTEVITGKITGYSNDVVGNTTNLLANKFITLSNQKTTTTQIATGALIGENIRGFSGKVYGFAQDSEVTEINGVTTYSYKFTGKRLILTDAFSTSNMILEKK